jgi:DeoR family fructose operon transcriptional repressor
MAGPGPNPVFATMRHEFIMKTMRAEGRASVAELAEQLSVTMETVRRDLVALERAGAVRRVHGGAVLTTVGVLPPVEARSTGASHALESIARRALDEIPPEGTVFLDAGHASLAVARLLPIENRLTVVTCDLAVAQLLAPHDRHTVILTGGRMRRDGAAVSGAAAEAVIAKVLVDVGFVVAPAVSVSRGLTTQDESEATIKATMIAASRRSVALAEGSAVGLELFQNFADLAELNLLITDPGADPEAVRGLRGRGLDVAVAD